LRRDFNSFEGVLTSVKAAGRAFKQAGFMAELPLIDPTTERVLSLPQETQFADHGIVSRTLLRTPQCRMVLFGFDEGQELSEHTSTQLAIVQVLDGECDFTLGGETRILRAGDLLSMPPNLPHAVMARSRFSMLLTLIKP